MHEWKKGSFNFSAFSGCGKNSEEQSKFTVSRDAIETDNENLVCIEWPLILHLTGIIVVSEHFFGKLNSDRCIRVENSALIYI